MSKFIIESLIHKMWVLFYLVRFAIKIVWRGLSHDISKLHGFEKAEYGKHFHKFKDAVYGTPEYTKLLEQFKPAVEHHYQHNSHHPEHYPNGYVGMDLLDFVEMFFDWKAASKKFKGGSITKSLAINKERFGISEDLFKIMENSKDL